MKEVNRIINDGILKASFFKDETICEFNVDVKRKKIWAVSLDLLFKFDEVCRTFNIKYTLAYGSLLGLIRHNGFIPWDDDVDVFMTRTEFEKLKLIKSEFSSPYYLQLPGEDGYCYSYAKLRNSNTSAISFAFRYESFNQGIPLDIFILDNFNSETIKEQLDNARRLIRESSALMRRSNPNPSEKDLLLLSEFPVIRDGAQIIADLEKVLRQNDDIPTDRYVCLSNLMYDLSRSIFLKEDIDTLLEADFYGHSVFISKNSDRVLRTIYGDYMTLPPLEERGKWHSTSLFDPDNPYTNYIKNSIVV